MNEVYHFSCKHNPNELINRITRFRDRMVRNEICFTILQSTSQYIVLQTLNWEINLNVFSDST